MAIGFRMKLVLLIAAFSLIGGPFLPAAKGSTPPDYLEEVSFKNFPDQITIDSAAFERKGQLLRSILNSLRFLRSRDAKNAYKSFQGSNVSRLKVEKSLQRFYLTLLLSRSYQELEQHLRSDFSLYRSTGMDGDGTVRFTGYFQPVYKASRERTGAYRYPVFSLPDNFRKWAKPHPKRVALEGYDGLGGPGTILQGHELAFLRSRYEVFMIQIQGSAILEFDDSTQMAIGFAAGTAHPFRGVSKGYLRKHNVSWHRIGNFFKARPNELNRIMSYNNRFIFFQDRGRPEPIGSLGVPVIAERSIAVDKLKLPPGAIGIIRTKIPERGVDGSMRLKNASRIVLNLDSGSAIKGPGRVDIFMGTGEEARLRASSIYSKGELYYLFAKE